jgi:hypothetical protein
MEYSSRLQPRRNQFVLGPSPAGLSSWQTVNLSKKLVLSHDPELPVVQSTGEHCSLVLMGFILDWREPIATNSQILDGLAESATTFEECVDLTAELGGRWAMLFRNSAGSMIFHDASGQRQICHTKPGNGERIWCASEPTLLAEVAQLDEDPSALSFIDRQEVNNNEYFWPGDRLPYLNSSSLLPNHALNIDDGAVRRFWPRQKHEYKPFDEMVERIIARLKGTITAASHRFPLALGLSAGWDSRTLLAACSEVSGDLIAYSSRQPGMKADAADLVLSKQLAQMLGVKHELVDPPKSVDPDFNALLQQHAWRPHQRFAAGMQGEYEKFELARVAMLGAIADFAKSPWRRWVTDDFSLSGKSLATMERMGEEEFAIVAHDEWLSSVPEEYGYNVLDLFMWELYHGRFLASNMVEFDFAWQDVLLPYNCRSQICDMLACDESTRSKVDSQLSTEIIRRLSPSLLQIPINPKPKPSIVARIRRKLRRFLRPS